MQIDDSDSESSDDVQFAESQGGDDDIEKDMAVFNDVQAEIIRNINRGSLS